MKKSPFFVIFYSFLLLFLTCFESGCGSSSGEGNSNVSDLWVSIPSGAPVSTDHTAIWTGTDMIVWGDTRLNSGGKYNPQSNSWNTISIANAPQERTLHTAIWSGTDMIVWGGINFNTILNTGGKYNPATDTWSPVSTINAPSARRNHSAVWTGTEMIIWGGVDANAPGFHVTDTGGRYNPLTDTWIATSTVNAPPATSDQAVWTGTEMIVWDGTTGGRYNPQTDTWQNMSTLNILTPRTGFTAVWSGSEMLIWGGRAGAGNPVVNSGSKYNPLTDSWSQISSVNAPSAREMHTAV
ncbi:MAG: hypothetical protein ABSC14_09580 [Desulfomonilia bacterium]|jgi:hypothetical protein